MTKKLIDRLEELADEMKVIVHQLREPSTIVEDVIEFEGRQYKKVDREAREGDVVICKNQTNTDLTPIKDGQAYLVSKSKWFKKHSFSVYSQYHNRTPETVDVYELIEDDTSLDWLDELFDEDKSPNQQRAEVIEMAKNFVDENGGDDFHFEIDEKERQILAWKIVRKGNGNEAVTGLATCHPNNVYNEYIGKAIALGRALNLDVSEFENAVQPNEIVSGMYCKHRLPNHEGKVTHFDGSQWRGEKGIDGSAPHNLTIINDTNAEYEVNA